MSDYIKEKKTEEFEEACADDKYESGKYGYCPHWGEQSKMLCPRCGCGLFESYPQTVVLSAPVWAHEYTCTKCGWILAVEVREE